MKSLLKHLLHYILIVVLSGCMGSADYMQAPQGAIKYGSGATPIYPDKLRVESEEYPIFRVLEKIRPPEATQCTFGGCRDISMPKILPTDSWRVTHIFGERYLIQSKKYNERLCKRIGFVNILGMCLERYVYAVYLNREGVVDGGWQQLPGGQLGGAERRIHLNPSPAKSSKWENTKIFVQD